MRQGTFRELHPVELSDEDRAAKGRQAARQALAIERFKEETETLDEAYKEQKKSRKTTEESMVSDLYKTSKAAESGREVRWVECREELVGMMVITVRADTGETVASRNAMKDELAGDAPKKPAGKLEPPTVEEKGAKLLRLILEHCAKPRTESLLLKALEKGAPEATPGERKAAIEAATKAGKIVENGDSLVVPKPPADEGVVPDDYDPRSPTH